MTLQLTERSQRQLAWTRRILVPLVCLPQVSPSQRGEQRRGTDCGGDAVHDRLARGLNASQDQGLRRGSRTTQTPE